MCMCVTVFEQRSHLGLPDEGRPGPSISTKNKCVKSENIHLGTVILVVELPQVYLSIEETVQNGPLKRLPDGLK